MNNEKAVEIRDILMDVICAIHRSMDTAMDASLVTGLTPWLATDVGSNFHIFSDLDTMAVNYHYIDPDNVKLIYEVLQQYIQWSSTVDIYVTKFWPGYVYVCDRKGGIVYFITSWI